MHAAVGIGAVDLLRRLAATGEAWRLRPSIKLRAALCMRGADVETQRRFFKETLASLLAKADPDDPVYFTDATHPAYTAHPDIAGSARARPAR